jgi:hypothetical protein
LLGKREGRRAQRRREEKKFDKEKELEMRIDVGNEKERGTKKEETKIIKEGKKENGY